MTQYIAYFFIEDLIEEAEGLKVLILNDVHGSPSTNDPFVLSAR